MAKNRKGSNVRLPKFGGKTTGDDFNDRFEKFLSTLLGNIFYGEKPNDFQSAEGKASISNKNLSLLSLIQSNNDRLKNIEAYCAAQVAENKEKGRPNNFAIFGGGGINKELGEIMLKIKAEGNLKSLNDLIDFCKNGDTKEVRERAKTISELVKLITSITELSQALPSVAKSLIFDLKISLLLSGLVNATKILSDKSDNFINAGKPIENSKRLIKDFNELINAMNKTKLTQVISGTVKTKLFSKFINGITNTAESINTDFDYSKLLGEDGTITKSKELVEGIADTAKATVVAGTLGIIAIPCMVGIIAFLGVYRTLRWLINKLAPDEAKNGVDLDGIKGMLSNKKDSSSKSNKNMGGIAGMVSTVVALGALLMFASVLMNLIDISALITFATTLSVFILAIGGAMALASIGVNEYTEKAMHRFLGLVVTCGVVLMVGAMLVMIPGLMVNALEFAAILGGFILAIAAIFVAYSYFSKMVTRAATEFGALILVSGIILMVGALLVMNNPSFVSAVFEFGALLVGFIGLVTAAYVFATKRIESSLPAAGALSLLIAISAGALCLGPIMLAKTFGTSWEDLSKAGVTVLGFGGLIVAFIFAMSFVGGKLTAASPLLTMGIAGAGALSILVGTLALALSFGPVLLFKGFGLNLTSSWEDLGKVGAVVGGYTVILAGFILGMTLIASHLTASSVIIFPAIAIAASLGILTLTVSGSLLMIAMALNKIKDIPDDVLETAPINIARVIGCIFGALGGLLTGEIDLLKADGSYEKIAVGKIDKSYFIPGLFTNSPFMNLVKCTSKIGDIISNISEGLQSYATLSMPTGFDKNGKAIGFRSFNDNDFTHAAVNISKVISTIFAALGGLISGEIVLLQADGNTYKTIKINPIPKDYLDEGLFTDSPFMHLINCTSKIGDIISNISEGLQSYATLSMPTGFDKNGKAIGFKKIDDKTFSDAAINIAKVVLYMFTSFAVLENMSLDNDTKVTDLFDENWFHKSKFSQLINNVAKVGDIIANMSKSLQDYANLKIPTGFDPKTGKATGYRPFVMEGDNNDFDKASTNIAKVITGIMQIVIDIANSDDFNKLKDEAINKTGDLFNAIKPISEVLVNIGDVIGMYASGKFAKYDDKGNIIGKPVEMTNTTFDKITGDNGSLRTVIRGIVSMFNCVGQETKSLRDEMGDFDKGIYDSIRNEDDTDDLKKKTEELEASQKSSIQAFIDKNIGVINVVIDTLKTIPAKVTDLMTEIDKVNLSGDLYTTVNGNWLSEKAYKVLYVASSNIIVAGQNFVNKFKQSIEKSDIDNAKNNFKTYLGIIQYEIDLLKKINDVDTIENNQAKNGQMGMKKLTADLSEFSTTVDGLDTKKLNDVIRLANAVTNMASSFGEVDELVKVISEKLTYQLRVLIAQLRESETYIRKGEEIQNKRHELIQKSIKSISSIMAQQLNVVVTQESSDSSSSSSTTDSSSSTNDNNNNSTEKKKGNNGTNDSKK